MAKGTTAMADDGGLWGWLDRFDHAVEALIGLSTIGGFGLGWLGRKLSAARALGRQEAREAEQFKTLREMVENVAARVALIEASGKLETEQLTQITATYRGLPELLNRQLDHIGERLNGHASRITDAERRHNATETKLEKMAERLAETATRREVADGFATITERLDRLFAKGS